MKAYYGSKELKNELMFEISEHNRLNHYLQGSYWNKDSKKGCAIGCLYSEGYGFCSCKDYSIHHKLEIIYNIPCDLLKTIDVIFESLSVKDSEEWSARVFGAIKVNQDLSLVENKYSLYFNSTIRLQHNEKQRSDKLIEIIKELQ